MNENEEEYLRPINILSDFNSRTGILASQLAALNSNIYPQALGSVANDLVNAYKSFSPIEDLFPKLDTSIYSSLTAFTREANLAISGLIKNENVLQLAAIVSEKPHSWLNGVDSIHSQTIVAGITRPIPGSVDAIISGIRNSAEELVGVTNPIIDQIRASTLAIESNFSKLSATSILAESSLSAFKWNDLGSQIGIVESAKLRLSDSFAGVSQSYSEVFKSIEAAPQTIVDFNPCIIRRTPIEYYTGVELCRTISVPEEAILKKEIIKNKILITKKILIDNKSGLENKLPRIDAELVRLWDGANQSLESSNPDNVRHFSISSRELLTQVLHYLSPDKEVKKWTSDPHHFKEGRPTREARLFYITRNINFGGFQKFVQKDVSATVEFINLFEEGTHKVKPSFTKEQLLALKAKTESTINFLIEIGLPDA